MKYQGLFWITGSANISGLHTTTSCTRAYCSRFARKWMEIPPHLSRFQILHLKVIYLYIYTHTLIGINNNDVMQGSQKGICSPLAGASLWVPNGFLLAILFFSSGYILHTQYLHTHISQHFLCSTICLSSFNFVLI